MHVLIISACEKRAIKKTRAILDSYAIRVGAQTWASAFTREGVSELRAALRRVATRQTAVACYQNDGRKRMKLLWIVGSRSTFGPSGHFPSGTTKRGHQKVPRITPQWVRIGCMLAESAGLMHDIGKASKWFQNMLRHSKNELSDIRHEWLSLKLLQTLRKNGYDWENAWSLLSVKNLPDVILGDNENEKLSSSKNSVSTKEEAIDFLVVSHHGLLDNGENRGSTTKNFFPPSARPRHIRYKSGSSPDAAFLDPYAPLDKKLLEDYARLQSKIDASGERTPAFWRAILVYVRAALIMADHVVSGEDEPNPAAHNTSDKKEAGNNIPVSYANTARNKKVLKQTLDLHLHKVAKRARDTMWKLAGLTALPQVNTTEHVSFVGLSEESVESIVRPVDSESRFAWQNICAQFLSDLRSTSADSPALVFNMASTGSGKTRMNARVACILSRDLNPRLSIALNLRSLTLQTGDALKSALSIGSDEIATVIGDRTAYDLYESASKISNAMPENILGDADEDELDVYGNDVTLPEWLNPFFVRERERAVLGIPLLVSTVDFLAEAGSPNRQGRHVKALLRLMSTDLVLDEIDSYEPLSLVAVLRLIQLAAMFRRNVICSSATLSKPVATAIDTAFRSGIAMLEALESTDGINASIPFIRAFIDDDLEPAGGLIASTENDFEKVYAERLDRIAGSVTRKPAFRLAEIQHVPTQTTEGWMCAVKEAVGMLHEDHKWGFKGGNKHVSFGLVRVANIRTAIDVARYLAKEMPHAKVACYHANEFLIARFYKEWRLDFLLSRSNNESNKHIEEDGEICSVVEESESNDIPFIVVATPVEEIGRDHDFDWAVIEPSSSQSIVQTAGRVNRHRLVPVIRPNIRILQFNVRYCRNVERGQGSKSSFIWPGYENLRKKSYQSHNLQDLLPWENGQLAVTSRIRFDVNNCDLAKYDDEAIHNEVSRFFGKKGENEGCFSQDPPPGIILTNAPYDASPLRTITSKKEIWRMQQDDDGEWFFEQKKRIREEFRIVNKWVYEDKRIARPKEPSPDNAWLSLTFEEMRDWCSDMGIEPDAGIYVELPVYETAVVKSHSFEYSPAFGFKRL